MLVTSAEVAADRAMVEEHMIDTCRVRRYAAANRGAWDEATGQYGTDAGSVVYEGKFRLQVRSESESFATGNAGDHEWKFRRAVAQFPIAGSEDIATDCVLEVLTCELDPTLVGRFYNLSADVAGKTHATHRRFAAREVLS